MTPGETVAFLECVLPAEGFYCAVTFKTAHPKPGVDKPRHKFFSSIEGLADFLIEQDRAGKTVYHACASYVEPTQRKQTNVKSVRSLWFEVDCDASGIKNGKPCYTDKETAAAAVLDFCTAAQLPRPLFVDSGGGIHCYWPLEQSLEPSVWQVHADQLKRLCLQHGVRADPARTSDLASILRTPGTHNRKRGEHLVQTEPCVQRHTIEAFSAFGKLGPSRHRSPSPRPGSNTSQQSRRGNILDRIEQATTYSSVYADDIADRCPQVDALRRSGAVDGWFLRVGVVAFCVDGDEKAHAWSANNYPEYSPDLVADRIERSRGLSGATTCEQFHARDPDTCERCPFWGKIKSPISAYGNPLDVRLSRSKLDRTNPGRSVSERTPFRATPERPGGRVSVGGIELPALRKPFRWSDDGKLVTVTEANDSDNETEIVISDFPIFLATVQTGELELGKFSYKFQRYLPQEGWKDVVLDARLMFGAASSAELADRGVVIHEPKHFANYVRHAVTDFHLHEETHVRYDQFGWKNDDQSFLYGTRLYTAAGPVEAIGAKEVATRSQWIGPKPKGNVHAWTDAADSLFAADMEGYSAIVLASFAAPLMRFQSRDEGGAIIHLFTPGSGQGKTTALTGAWTVWGTKEGLSLTNDDTRVSKPIAMGTLGNLPVIYDELRDKDPEVIKRMVIMFTEGRDRMRGMIDGTIRHTKANWQTMLLSAANASLIDQLQGDGIDAPAFRVLELAPDARTGLDKAKGERLKRILNENAGTAGDAYMRYLTQPEVLSFARSALERWTQDIWDHTRLESAHRFRVRAVGAIAVAAALVNKLELVHFQTDRIVEWLVNQLGAGINAGTVSATVPAEQATSALGAFLNAHLGEMLVVPDKFKPKQARMQPIRSPVHRLTIRYEIAPNRLFIAESAFREWATKEGISPRLVLAALEKNQVVIGRKRQITLSGGTDIAGGQVMCIEINASHPVMSGLVASVEELQVPHRSGRMS